jgi:hypothetical protein
MKYSAASFGDFKCRHCGQIVTSAHVFSGVNNRNHCPYCLWSCHLDLFESGDRLSACKGQMQPIGLTMKKSRNKYRLGSGGELMLIHECIECQTLSINRIAADDDSENILNIFQDSFLYGHQTRQSCEGQGIVMLGANATEMIYKQLYGQSIEGAH